VGRRFLSEQVITSREEFEERRAMLAEMLNDSLAELCRGALRQLLEDLMRQEQDWILGYHAHQRLPQDQGRRPDYRNGCYHRDVVTTFGPLRGVAVPRSRNGAYHTRVLPRYQRRLGEVDQALRDLFLAGISQRRVGEIAEELFGEAVSATTVSNLCKALDEQVSAFHSRSLEDDVVYMYLDGVSMKVKGAYGVAKRVLLVVLAISVSGHKYIVDYRLVRRETLDHWHAFLHNLYERGLRGARLRCITSDGNPGLIAALALVYGWVPRQRCWVHKLRNVLGKLKVSERLEAKAGLVKIYAAPNRRAALAAARAWYEHWHPIDAEAADCLWRDLEQLLTIFSLPAAHRVLMRTTNPLERVFVEVRRRTRPILAFNNDASCERVCLSVFGYLQASWKHKPLKAITQKT
jgi:putative transposase